MLMQYHFQATAQTETAGYQCDSADLKEMMEQIQ